MVYIVFNLVERSGITTDLSSPLHFQFFRHLNMAKSEMRAKDEKFQSSRHVHFSDIRIIPVRMLDHKQVRIFFISQCCNLNVSER